MDEVVRCWVTKFADRPTRGEKLRPVCDEKDRPAGEEKAVRPPPPPPPLALAAGCPPPPPPAPLFGGAAFAGNAKALANTMAVSHPVIFVMIGISSTTVALTSDISSNCAEPNSFT
ncbi:MAG: hypothetical protein ACHP82_04685 [Hyphomicrobiales bacterium]